MENIQVVFAKEATINNPSDAMVALMDYINAKFHEIEFIGLNESDRLSHFCNNFVISEVVIPEGAGTPDAQTYEYGGHDCPILFCFKGTSVSGTSPVVGFIFSTATGQFQFSVTLYDTVNFADLEWNELIGW